jgi:hypothetical protein
VPELRPALLRQEQPHAVLAELEDGDLGPDEGHELGDLGGAGEEVGGKEGEGRVKIRIKQSVVDVGRKRRETPAISPCRATSWKRATLPVRRLASDPQELENSGPRARRQSPAAGAGADRAELAETTSLTSASRRWKLCAQKKKKKKRKESARSTSKGMRSSPFLLS